MQPLACSAQQEPEQEPAFNILIQANGEPRFTPKPRAFPNKRTNSLLAFWKPETTSNLLKGIPGFEALKFQKIL